LSLEQLAAAFIGPLEAAHGPVLTAYRDIAGVWTIGYGTTFFLDEAGAQVPVTEGLVWTADQCMAALAYDVSATLAAVVAANTWHPWTNSEIVALTSLAYNIGQSAYRSSSVLRLHNEGDKGAAAAAFLLWDKAHVDGELLTVTGLLDRRKAEVAKYLS
jgi:lysozyme